MDFVKSITNDDLKALPAASFGGEIFVFESLVGLRDKVSDLKKNLILGFDTETKPSFKKGANNQNKVALLQLSSERTALLIRLNKIGLPKVVIDILADPSILKIGAAVKEDIRRLQQIAPFQPAGFVDLQEVVKKYGIENFSLKKMSGIILGQRVSKSQQLSDWAAEELSPAQRLYASTDAWVCQRIYKELLIHPPVPPMPEVS